MSSQPLSPPHTTARLTVLIASIILAILLLFAAYQVRRTPTVDVGNLGAIPFVSSGFYADEPDIGFRYRWTKSSAQVSFPGIGDSPIVDVTVRAQGPRPADASKPITMSVYVNDTLYRAVAAGASTWVTLTNDVANYTFRREGGSQGETRPAVVRLETSTFQPKGDARTLGAKVISVGVGQDPNWSFNLPPLWVFAWLVALITGLFWLASPFAQWWVSFVSLIGAALAAGLYLLWPLHFAAFLPPAAAVAGTAGLLVWQRARVRRWPAALDAIRAGSGAPLLLGIAMLIYALMAFSVIPRVDWIGHADYAENAVIARNLVNGKGLTVDYVAQFYTEPRPGLSHPADTWPLLQPLMIAPFFALFGPATWAAKLPNLFLLLALVWAVYAAGSRLWDRRVGLLAGLLVLVHPYFFNAVLYPINDLVFTLIFFVLAWLVWRGAAPKSTTGRFPTFSGLASFGRRNLIYTGVLSGLLIWSKPSGATLLVGLGLWGLLVWWRSPRGRVVPWKSLGVLVGSAIVVLLPLVIRNLLAFRSPFYSTESYDVWILRYWPLHDWEDIYKVYLGKELPHPRWIVGGKFGYQNLVDAVVTNFKWVWQKAVLSDPSQGDYVMGLLPLSGALVGIAAGPRKIWNLCGMLALSLGVYSLFVLLYWHFEGRYFQVFVPWLYLLLAWGLLWVFDRLRGWSGDLAQGVQYAQQAQQSRWWQLLVLPIALAALFWPSISAISAQVQSDTAPTGFVGDMQWLKDHSTPADVIMTRDPWELNWYTQRKAVMIPNDDLSTIESTARKYGVTMLQLGGPVDGINVRGCPGSVGSRPALDGLYCGQERPGFRLLYRQGGLTIYRLGR